jgi:hypothetical protein
LVDGFIAVELDYTSAITATKLAELELDDSPSCAQRCTPLRRK